MKFNVCVHYDGVLSFIVEADSTEEAEEKAEQLFSEAPDSELADNLADVFVCDAVALDK